MPIYGFECAACGHTYDRLQKLADADPTQCPACGAEALRRQLTAPSFRLAGSGWYETDFKKDGDKKRNLVESSDGPKSDSASSGAADSKLADSKPTASESKPAATAAAASAAPSTAAPSTAAPSSAAPSSKPSAAT